MMKFDQINKFIKIDEEGYFVFSGQQLKEPDEGKALLNNLHRLENESIATKLNDVTALVEAYDQPIVVQQVECNEDKTQWTLIAHYGVHIPFELNKLSIDEWDRFLGRTENNIPFVFSRKAQNEFFNIVDEFYDDGFTVNGQYYSLPYWLTTAQDKDYNEIDRSDYWTKAYNDNETPGWEMNAPNPALVHTLPQLKLTRSRVAVLGCGSGNDAAHWAEQGHLVTAFDFSPEAIKRAQDKYSHIKNLEFIEQDVFNLDEKYLEQFDIVFEHTLYCAIRPQKRDELVKVWRKLLHSEGHLLGIFFAMDRPSGPPFGGSEWEIERRTHKSFSPLYWTRWQASTGGRQGKELVVYARLTNS